MARPRMKSVHVPTDDEILALNIVRLDQASIYIGWSTATLRWALQQERAPFGFAVQGPSGSWAYNISPGLLVAYKRGTLPTYRLKDVIALAADGVEQVLNARLAAFRAVTDALNQTLDQTGSEEKTVKR